MHVCACVNSFLKDVAEFSYLWLQICTNYSTPVELECSHASRNARVGHRAVRVDRPQRQSVSVQDQSDGVPSRHVMTLQGVSHSAGALVLFRILSLHGQSATRSPTPHVHNAVGVGWVAGGRRRMALTNRESEGMINEFFGSAKHQCVLAHLGALGAGCAPSYNGA